MNTPELLLASTSPYRRELLARLGLPFRAVAPQVDESPQPGEAPAERALRLARLKARAVAAGHPAAMVLGSDQVAACEGRLLRKPGEPTRCVEQLLACSGRSVEFHTAAVLLAAGREHSTVDRTVVRFRALDRAGVERYVARERPWDCAGGFRCEGMGIALFESIESRDPTALIGLPLIWTAAALRDAGLDALAQD